MFYCQSLLSESKTQARYLCEGQNGLRLLVSGIDRSESGPSRKSNSEQSGTNQWKGYPLITFDKTEAFYL